MGHPRESVGLGVIEVNAAAIRVITTMTGLCG